MKKTVLILLVALLVVTGVALGFYFGQNRGEQKTEETLETLGALVNQVYPPPPEVMQAMGGTIKNIYGATINLEVLDLDDYLPHADGSPRAREFRFVSVSGATEIVLVDYTKPQQDGSPTITPLAFSDLKPGDEIKVMSKENIRDAKKFDVTRVEVIRY